MRVSIRRTSRLILVREIILWTKHIGFVMLKLAIPAVTTMFQEMLDFTMTSFHYATSRKVAGSSPNEVDFFN
jgi:hypothetical protein